MHTDIQRTQTHMCFLVLMFRMHGRLCVLDVRANAPACCVRSSCMTRPLSITRRDGGGTGRDVTGAVETELKVIHHMYYVSTLYVFK